MVVPTETTSAGFFASLDCPTLSTPQQLMLDKPLIVAEGRGGAGAQHVRKAGAELSLQIPDPDQIL